MLVLQDIARSYRDRQVLDGASLSLPAGTTSWLGGANGAGKTTLLRVAVGMLSPQRGSVALDGLDPVADRRAYQRRLGYTPAGNGGLYARLKVGQHLALWADLALVNRARRGDLIAQAMRAMALEDLDDRRVDRLSTGQRQRVRLAMAFLHEPDVVLLDEPHASLDDDGLACVDAALGALIARGGAALWCSPTRASSGLRSDHHYVIEGGKVHAR